MDLLIRKRGGWDDGGTNRLGMGDGGWGYDDNNNEDIPLMIVGCVIYIDTCYQGVGGGLFWLKFIDRSLLAL